MVNMAISETLNRHQSPSKEHYVTLLWPRALSSSPGFPVVAGQSWCRPNGKIQAWYKSKEELEACNWAIRTLVREEDETEIWEWAKYNGGEP